MRIRERGSDLSGKKRRDECDVVVYFTALSIYLDMRHFQKKKSPASNFLPGEFGKLRLPKKNY